MAKKYNEILKASNVNQWDFYNGTKMFPLNPFI